jgi:hypothetical protein
MNYRNLIKQTSKKLKKESLIVFGFWALILGTVFFVVALTFTTVLSPKEKYLSITNFYTEPVRIKYLDENKEIEMFDIYTRTLLIKDDFVIEVYDMGNKKLNEVKVKDIGYHTQLISVVLTPDEKCFFEANVKGLYYTPNTGDLPQITSIKTLAESPTAHVVKVLKPTNTIYVYPGNSNLEDLPENINNSRVVGIYPINCADIKNTTRLLEAAKFFATYNTEKQQEYFEQTKSQINASTSSEELEGLVLP